jgi:ABC-type Fe3+-siderophore transport system permease subunit/ABC-type cobalamin/Fe3+-siderophores transport system ATPase subunit
MQTETQISKTTLLGAQDISFRYPDSSFDIQISKIDVVSGEIHSLIGANGSGKSTLLRIIARILKPDSGHVNLHVPDKDADHPNDWAKVVAFLPQEVTPIFSITVIETVMLGRHPWKSGLGFTDERDLEICLDAMKRTEILHLQDRAFENLSGGEKQRVLLASVLAQESKIILLDEPTHFLDVHHQSQVFQLLRSEAKRGTAILIATHDLTLAGHFSDRISLLKSGRLEIQDAPKKVLQEQFLRNAYGSDLRVIQDPEFNLPCVLPNINQNQNVVGAQFIAPSSHSTPPPTLTFSRYLKVLSLFAIFFIAALFITPTVGFENLNLFKTLPELFNTPKDHWSISAQILSLRLPRILMGVLAGMTLGCIGASFQSLLKNPLAEPYTLGLASSSSLGAVVALSFPALSFKLGPISGVQSWALGFALLNVAFLWFVSKKFSSTQRHVSLILLGITWGLISGGFIMLVRFLSNPLTMRALDQWMVGGLDVASWREVFPVFPFLIPGLGLVLMSIRDLNQLEFGDEVARSRGVDSSRVQREILFGGSLAVASVVAVVGPIGFVGLLVPHLVRRLIGSDQRLVLPCSMLTGAGLLLIADAFARSLSIGGKGAELPVGILTSLIGGPIFLGLFLFARSHANKITK